jgi:hypothetical protein
MKPDQKNKTMEKKTDKSKSDLGAKRVDAAHAEQIRGGLTQRLSHDDESPK